MSDNPKLPYTSVIKINGVPILPPVITPALRKELLRFQQQAVKLERHLAHCRELKKHLDEILDAYPRPLSQITFGDNSHLEALDISDRPRESRKLKNVHLSKDLIEVTQYNSNGLKTICSNVNLDNNLCDKESEVDVRLAQTPPKPKLIRSNSYTLETPSPLLLKHLEQCTNENSLENNHSSLENSEFNSLNTVKDATLKSPTIEVYQTDISVQQITVNTSGSGGKEEKKEAFFTKSPFNALEPDGELLHILKDIPDVYANQILELLRKQHIEQKDRLERYDRLNEEDSTHNKNVNNDDLIDFSSIGDNPTRPNTMESCGEGKLRRSSTFSMSPSQSLYYSVSSDTSQLAPPEVEVGVLREKNGYWEGFVKHDSGCSKELFPEIDPITIKVLKQEQAASIINAFVRGYLTRRLLKTEKVQILIGTVKEVLVCALELHGSENIDEKDVELHRRLINQLSAALYSFHEIFFELSKSEQMAIIATDRQRKQEKLKRAQSGRSSSRNLNSSRSDSSSRSSSKHKLINPLTPQSLTKV